MNYFIAILSKICVENIDIDGLNNYINRFSLVYVVEECALMEVECAKPMKTATVC